MENCIPFTDDVMIVLVHKCVQQTPLGIALGNIRIHSASFECIKWFSIVPIKGDPRGDNLMVGSISQKLLTELGIQTEDAECKLMGDKCNFVNFVLIIKVMWVNTIQRQTINTLVIKMTSQY